MLEERIEKISFGIRLKQLIKENCSQSKFAQDLEISANTVTSWIKGTPFKRRYVKDEDGKTRDILQEIADYFDVDPDYLLCTQIEERKIVTARDADREKRAAETKAKYEQYKTMFEQFGATITENPEYCSTSEEVQKLDTEKHYLRYVRRTKIDHVTLTIKYKDHETQMLKSNFMKMCDSIKYLSLAFAFGYDNPFFENYVFDEGYKYEDMPQPPYIHE